MTTTENADATALPLLQAGDASPPLEVGPITRTQIVRYAGAGGDFNPIHHDELFATGAGQPSVFAHGLLTAGILSRLVSSWLGLTNVKRYAVRFTGQVWPGDVLTCQGEVDDVAADGDGRVATCSFRVTRQSGDEVVRASAIARVA